MDSVVVLRGEVDLSTGLADSLSQVITLHAGSLVIDLSEVESIDTPFVHVLAKAQRVLNAQGRKLMFRSPSRLDALVRDLAE
jgi:anti-anti-sigma regulatory factor